MRSPRHVGIVLFEDFELLDAFGPIELLSRLPEEFTISLVGPTAAPVRSRQGTLVVADTSYADAPAPDIVLVPGGQGTRILAADHEFLSWLSGWARSAQIVTSVCTGSALLAASGLLEGYRATSNKRAFEWAAQHGDDVSWQPQARWVVDRNRWTSSGVAAGMDMTHALIADLVGTDAATEAAASIEYEPHTDPDVDPFAPPSGAA
ncbi:DJ-1/PfpI family protein [Paramicrobacterium agarici]|uniref:DJ-1/PfpI family protein n=1 Tax=Paramicrobacterium agarici TaxID=630514 RepID=UPI00115159AB|nr:DJ-1/PfpI family protein [Microbacterium agarici]TQO22148.1 DJ-1/PfpI family protein [Microbacterium agarici]